MNHSWHVHVNPEGGDTHSAMGERCKSLGGHYNPYNVDLAVSIVANVINLKLLMATYDHDSFYHQNNNNNNQKRNLRWLNGYLGHEKKLSVVS